MSRRLLILVSVYLLSVLECLSQIISPDDKLRQIIIQDGQVEVEIPLGSVTSMELLTANASILTVHDKQVYISLSRLTVDWFIAQKYNYKILGKAVSKSVISAPNVSEAMNWDKYPTYLQYDSIMQSFSKIYPSLCRLDTIGTSVNGKLVLALKISASAASNENKPEVFYTSTMHGDETGGFILMLHLADYLLKNYSVVDRVTNLLDNLAIWINPLANPDGTYGQGNIISSPTRYNANGYDLNRNFPDPIIPNTVRQKETLDMIRFMRNHKFVLSANFHSGSEVVNYPWDKWLSKLHADDSWFNSISRSYADTAHVYGGPEYMNFLDNGVSRGAVWYIIYGGRQDFVTWELHGREVTIELDDQYVTPEAQLTLLWLNNWHSMLGYLENALYGIHGVIRNVNTHVPVPAKVFINGHDKDSSQVYSDTLTGSFVRFLYPGSWDLTFSATGYLSQTITNIVVAPFQKTEVTVDMSPVPDYVETTNSMIRIHLYPNPAKEILNAVLPDNIEGIMNVSVINQSGMLMSDFNAEVTQGTPLVIDVKSLSAGAYTVVLRSTLTRSSFFGRFIVIK
jgi:hypothetical protein